MLGRQGLPFSVTPVSRAPITVWPTAGLQMPPATGRPVLDEGDGDTPLGDSGDELPRAVERVDDPDPPAFQTAGIVDGLLGQPPLVRDAAACRAGSSLTAVSASVTGSPPSFSR